MTRPILTLFIVGLALCLASCGSSDPVPDRPKSKKPAHLVEVYIPQLRSVSTAHERTGDVRARRLVRVHAREEGRIEELPWFEGDQIDEGEVLAKIDDSLLTAELAKANARTRQARLDLERFDGLIAKNAASQDELAQARTELDVALAEQQILETRIEHTRLTAPFSGVVTERLAEIGDMAAKNDHLLTVMDPQSLVIEVAVSELTLPQLRLGDPVKVAVDALNDVSLEGTILRIHPALDELTRQGIVEIGLDPLPQGMRKGQFARVILTTAARNRLLVPFSSLQRDRDGEYLFRVDGKDHVEAVRVRSGTRTADQVEILEGIQSGDRIVSRGFLGLREGMAVRVLGEG